VTIYGVRNIEKGSDQEETFGLLCFAEIISFGALPDYEMEQLILREEMPSELTYPLIQPKLIEKVKRYLDAY
jgi:8-oxo-dGTP diphosphatase